MECYSAFKKGGDPAICDNMDECGGHYAKQNKPDRQRQILYAPCVCGILRKQYSYKKIPLVVPRERGRGVEELDEGGENVQTSS